MIEGFTLLLLAQLLGEAVTRALNLGIPGPILGLIFLIIYISLRKQPDSKHFEAAKGLLSHLSLMFVPAGVGLIDHGRLLAQNGNVIMLALIVSTFLGLIATAYTFVLARRMLGPQGSEASTTGHDTGQEAP
jgi:holin-like protein